VPGAQHLASRAALDTLDWFADLTGPRRSLALRFSMPFALSAPQWTHYPGLPGLRLSALACRTAER
jgi:hypothetical protein